MLTVKELIEKLQRIENKEQEIKIQTFKNDLPVGALNDILVYDNVIYITEEFVKIE